MVEFSPYCPEYAPFFGFLGAALALVFGNMGAAYGTWKSAIGLATIAKLPRHKVQTEMVMKSIMPVILSGVCGIFGLIIAVIISSGLSAEPDAQACLLAFRGQTPGTHWFECTRFASLVSVFSDHHHLLTSLFGASAIGRAGSTFADNSYRFAAVAVAFARTSFRHSLPPRVARLILSTRDTPTLRRD